VTLGGNRYYNKKRHLKTEKFRFTKEQILANIVAAILGVVIAVFLYFYVLQIRVFDEVGWEVLVLLSFVFLSIPIGIGSGTHLVTMSFVKLMSRKSSDQELVKTLRFFHYTFSHQLFFIPGLLMFYLIALLDLFKGRSLDLHSLQFITIVVSGIILGAVSGILFIITRCHRLILPAVLVLTASLGFASLNESRNLFNHPVALLIAMMYTMITLGLVVYSQTKINLRLPVKRWIKHWLHWDIEYL